MYAESNSSGFTTEDEEIFSKFMPFIAIAIRNTNLYSQLVKESQTNKVLLELATIVFDESSTTVDNLVSKILFNFIFLLECQKCQVILLNNTNKSSPSVVKSPQYSSNSRKSSKFESTQSESNKNINKYFDRVYELNYNDLFQSNEDFSKSVLVEPSPPHFYCGSPELDIISNVIQTGEILNIQDAQQDTQYAKLLVNMKMDSLLCIPVMNSEEQVVAVIFACNKTKNSSLKYFSQSDITVAQSFALFCGIGIQNIMMYEKVVRALNMQQVALDVLSYHVSSSQEECDRLIEEKIMDPYSLGLLSFGFDENSLDDMGTLRACVSMINDLGFIEKFNIPYDILCRFFLTVKKNYRTVAYHNWRHGFNVMTAMYSALTVKTNYFC
jgi:GAF domain-containing protein